MIDQLRDPKGHYPDNFGTPLLLCMCQDAADEIERLKSENQTLTQCVIDQYSENARMRSALARISQRAGGHYSELAAKALTP